MKMPPKPIPKDTLTKLGKITAQQSRPVERRAARPRYRLFLHQRARHGSAFDPQLEPDLMAEVQE
jgi:hypothetical protein